MESIVLITEEAGLLSFFKKAVQEAFPKSVITDQGGLTGFRVQNEESDRLYIDYYGTSLETIIGWTEDELALVSRYFPKGFHVYCIHYRNIVTIKKTIMNIAIKQNMLLDNDFGTFLPINEFIVKMMQNPQWDWRNDTITG